MKLTPSAPARVLCATVIILAVMFTRDLRVLVSAFMAAAGVCIYVRPVRGIYIRFLLWIWLPLAAWGVVVWGWIVGAPPGSALHTDAAGGALYAIRIGVRLGAAASVLQALLLSEGLEDLGRGLFTLRVPRPIVLVVLGVFALGPELRKRTEQVLTARAARGLLNRGGRWRAAGETARTLVPLVTWGFRSAALRFEFWNQKQLLESPWLGADDGFRTVDGIYIALSVLWGAASVWFYVKAR